MSRISPNCFEDSSCFDNVSWETETTKNSSKIPAIFQCHIPRRIRKKITELPGERERIGNFKFSCQYDSTHEKQGLSKITRSSESRKRQNDEMAGFTQAKSSCYQKLFLLTEKWKENTVKGLTALWVTPKLLRWRCFNIIFSVSKLCPKKYFCYAASPSKPQEQLFLLQKLIQNSFSSVYVSAMTCMINSAIIFSVCNDISTNGVNPKFSEKIGPKSSQENRAFSGLIGACSGLSRTIPPHLTPFKFPRRTLLKMPNCCPAWV